MLLAATLSFQPLSAAEAGPVRDGLKRVAKKAAFVALLPAIKIECKLRGLKGLFC
jgi:hypothetical protein